MVHEYYGSELKKNGFELVCHDLKNGMSSHRIAIAFRRDTWTQLDVELINLADLVDKFNNKNIFKNNN